MWLQRPECGQAQCSHLLADSAVPVALLRGALKHHTVSDGNDVVLHVCVHVVLDPGSMHADHLASAAARGTTLTCPLQSASMSSSQKTEDGSFSTLTARRVEFETPLN